MASINNFDLIAPVYDGMAAAVFGKAIQKAPQVFLKYLPPVQSILVVGGGTGKILKPLLKHSAQALITYLEPSTGMMLRAQKWGDLYPGRIAFIEAPVETASLSDAGYDLIFTPFILDLFSSDRLSRVINILFQTLKPQGHWMHSDFYVKEKDPWWQQNLLRSMHLFFRVTANMESKSLKDFNQYFKAYPLQQRGSQSFYFGMIQTIWYQKGSA